VGQGGVSRFAGAARLAVEDHHDFRLEADGIQNGAHPHRANAKPHLRSAEPKVGTVCGLTDQV
jgi:hypothetical protein